MTAGSAPLLSSLSCWPFNESNTLIRVPLSDAVARNCPSFDSFNAANVLLCPFIYTSLISFKK